ncbi:hypothetical protein Poli38472_010717 [Pythium oligandrum]|uniref:Uncharacterized protein n=1 Tax=Pythium oligandrum TaxID=41045 RepID=A0A8K1CEP3_PYTOL|nr:hypothetical protein Poli38472_010717 [Pythium oligandrum]|eukprot:TMW61654.1 hypothetical protein Poli38472_010717 [Pythium oligandrum]
MAETTRTSCEQGTQVRVLYVCSRSIKSSGYPKATPELDALLRPQMTVSGMADVLCLIVEEMHVVAAHFLKMAAAKLLCESTKVSRLSYRNETMFGVAALLCRLGVRPLSCHLVGDHMSVLDYVDASCAQAVSGYGSDPILALGATSLWYHDKFDPLGESMLPRFRQLVSEKVVDCGDGGTDSVVARLLLLLAMDACSASVGARSTTDTSTARCRYNGSLVRAVSFVERLMGRRECVVGGSVLSESTDMETESAGAGVRGELDVDVDEDEDRTISY